MKQPNIVFILSDDHGQWATGAYGNQDVKTPNIDMLAKEGIRFDNFFCTSPVCSPARASIVTGKIPSQHGVHDWLNGGNLRKKEFQDMKVDMSVYKSWLNDKQLSEFVENSELITENQVRVYDQQSHKSSVSRECNHINYLKDLKTYTEILADNGYNCGMSGKWHLGSTSVKQAGFDFWCPIAKGGTSYKYPEVIEDGVVQIKDQYVSEYIADNAINFLKNQNEDKPFYLSVHFTAPHSPWGEKDHPKQIWDQYDEDGFSKVSDKKLNKYASPTAPYPNRDRSARRLLHGYYTAITAMDEQIGRIIKSLEESGLDDNTIIIYTSDNGMNLGQHGVWGKGNGTYPLNFYEESIKIPFILKMANNKSKIDKTLLSQYDIYPTILELCNLSVELDDTYPGRSFKPLLNNECLENEPLVIFDEYGPNRMIRTNEFKLILRYKEGEDELYNLIDDPFERTNLLNNDMSDDIYKMLTNKLELWFKQYTTQKFDGRTTNVTGFGQYGNLNGTNQPFEARLNKFKG